MPQYDQKRLQALFAAAVEIPPQLQDELLARECGDQPEVPDVIAGEVFEHGGVPFGKSGGGSAADAGP